MVAQLVRNGPLIHTLMQLVPGDLQIYKELRAEKTLLLITVTLLLLTEVSNSTLDLSGRNISWRYNSNNSWDLFDEDTDEVILLVILILMVVICIHICLVHQPLTLTQQNFHNGMGVECC